MSTEDCVGNREITALRHALGLTQTQLARVLGYAHSPRVSELERGVRVIDAGRARLLRAYASGYRPVDWPDQKGQTNEQ